MQGSVAQLYRALDFGSSGWGLESLRGHFLSFRIKRTVSIFETVLFCLFYSSLSYESIFKYSMLYSLSRKIINMLRNYYKAFRPKVWLFEGQIVGEQYGERSLQNIRSPFDDL